MMTLRLNMINSKETKGAITRNCTNEDGNNLLINTAKNSPCLILNPF